MSSPVNEKEQYSFPVFEPDSLHTVTHSSEEDGTLQDYPHDASTDGNHLYVHTSYADGLLRLGCVMLVDWGSHGSEGYT